MKLFGTFFSKKFFSSLKTGVLGNLLSSMYGVIDLLIAGALLGPSAVETVEIILPIKQMGTFIACLFMIGPPIIYGKEIGRFDKTAADGTFSLGILCTGLCGVLYALILLLFRDSYFSVYAENEAVRQLCLEYMNYIFIDVSLRPCAGFLYFMLIMDGDTETASVSVVVQFVSRVLLSLILTPVMGISGLGLASVLSITAVYIVEITHFFRSKNTLRFTRNIPFKKIPRIIRYALVDSSSYAVSAVFCIYLNTVFSARFGADALLLASAVNLVYQLHAGLDGVGIAMEVFVNIYRGECSHAGVKNTLGIGIRWALILGSVVSVAIFIFAGKLTEYLGITDSRLFALVTAGIRIAGFSCIGSALNYCLSSFYLYIDRIGLGLLFSVADALLPIAAIELCAAFSGEIGVFTGVLISPFCTLAILLLYIYLRYKSPYAINRPANTTDDALFEYRLESNDIFSFLDNAEAYLKERSVSQKAVNRVRLLLEEVLFYTLEENQNNEEESAHKHKRIYGECALILGNEITVILRDNGKIIDFTDSDRLVTSFRSFFLTLLVETKTNHRRNLITVGSNRCSFSVPFEVKESISGKSPHA